MALTRRDFIKGMGAALALAVMPVTSVHTPQMVPFIIDDTISVSVTDEWFGENIIKPAAKRLADDIDTYIGKMLLNNKV